MKKLGVVIILWSFLCSAGVAADVAKGMALVQGQCAGCHALQPVDGPDTDILERSLRKAPPLNYAGNKFRQDWLVDWLQEPTRLRPAGYYPPHYIIAGPDGDIVDKEKLPAHPKLSKDEATAASAYLMTLRPADERIAAVTYEPGNMSLRMGQMNFGKFNGCDACHRDAPDFGGLSGPELYTAWDRLQPKFIASFIAEPVAWDRHTLMPDHGLKAAVVKKLSDYLKTISEDKE